MSLQNKFESTTNSDKNKNENKSEHNKFTKHQLADQYRISLRTVYRTLETIGLSTKKGWYDDKEVYLFALARGLLNKGYTRRQVPSEIRAFLTQKQIVSYEPERITPPPE